MADQYTPEEIQEIFQAYNDAVQKNIPISKELAQQMQDAQKGIKNWTNEVNASWKKLGTSAADLGKNLYKGGKGAGQFGDAVETASDALSMLILLIPGVGIAAKAAAFAIKTFGKAINVAGKQGEALFKSYKELSQVGAATAGGLQDVFVNAQKLGYGIEDLDKMVALVAANSETLAKFSLSAGDGASAFADAMAGLVRDPELRILGKMPEDINAAGSAYIRQQVMLGRSQREIGSSLSEQTRRYIVDLDRLQRLTGVSADALQKQQETLMAEDAYNVYMESLEMQGEAGKVQADKIREVTARLPQYEKLIAQAIGGNVEAQQQLMFIAPSLINDLRDPVKSASATISTFNKEATNAKAAFKDLAALGGGTQDVIGSVADLNKAIVATTDDPARREAVERSTRVTDAGVKNLAALDLSQMEARESLQGFVQLGVNPATLALRGLAGAASGVTGILPGKTGRPAAPTGGAPAPSGTPGAAAPSTGAGMGLTGLPIKSGATAGGAHSENLTALARNIYEKFGADIVHFSGFNDGYARDAKSKHRVGQALDFTLKDPSKSAQIAAAIRTMGGVSYVQDEYLNPSSKATAGHIHAEVSAMMGGIATGPTSGYRAVLHGTEAIVPLPDGKKIPVEMPGFTNTMIDQTALMTQQLGKLDDLITVMRRQVDVSNKILQMTS